MIRRNAASPHLSARALRWRIEWLAENDGARIVPELEQQPQRGPGCDLSCCPRSAEEIFRSAAPEWRQVRLTGPGKPISVSSLIRLRLAFLLQLPLSTLGKLLPGLGHLFELLAVRWQRGSRHLPAFGGVLAIVFQLVQRASSVIGGRRRA